MSTANADHWLCDSPVPASLNILGIDPGIRISLIGCLYDQVIKSSVPSLTKLGAAHTDDGDFVLNTLHLSALPWLLAHGSLLFTTLINFRKYFLSPESLPVWLLLLPECVLPMLSFLGSVVLPEILS